MFLSVYVQIFFLITFLENKKNIVNRKGEVKLASYPGVTIIVPCWNEEETINKTVKSLLNLNYPKDKLKLLLVDDGSTDNTLNVLKKFEKYSNVKIFHKENGGKHTALNLGIDNTETEFVGCLDADSVAHSESLVRIMSYFENNKEVMAVSPSIIVDNAKNFIQKAQRMEYYMAVYVKKMLGILGAIHVTPGPLTIFRKKVFDDLGYYHHAHNTEDMEIAYRMQVNGYKIDQCNDAVVYTNTPSTVMKLHKQRVRWIYGFINNTLDYKNVIFKKKYGNFSMFTLPTGILSVFTASYLFGRAVYSLGEFLYEKIMELSVTGVTFVVKAPSVDPFFFNTQSLTMFINIMLYSLVVFSIVVGFRMIKGKGNILLDLVYFFVMYGTVAPFWLFKAMYNTVVSKSPSWR